MRHAVIMAGGSGTRLWPWSRRAQPKQLLPLIDGQSLLQLSAARLDGLIEPARLWVCAAEAHRAAIAAELPDLPPTNWIGEPVGRDTLAAAGLSAALLAARDPEAVMLLSTADHVIEPRETFAAAVDRGFSLVEAHPRQLVTFGVRPTRPATGYGYLHLGPASDGGALLVKEFREKPDATTAGEWLAAGPEQYLWNSGLFVWRASTFLDALRRYEPAAAEILAEIAAAWDTPAYAATLATLYPTVRRISLDYAVMEPAANDPALRVVAVPLDLRWLDVGSWPSLAETLAADGAGNRQTAQARTALVASRDNLIATDDPEHLIALVGCEGLVVVHTAAATLVCPADQAERIKELQAQLAADGADQWL